MQDAIGCAAALLSLAVLAVFALAVVAFRRSHANTAALAKVETELARVRELLESVQRGGEAPAFHLTPRAAAEVERAAAPGATPPRPASPPPTPPAAPHAPSPPVTIAAAASAAGEAVPTPAAPHARLEELVGARLLLWVGAMALALAGAFLVKISFERGWISPAVRVALGVAFGVALLTLSETLRRASGRISEALAAAGIADLFACFLAAVHLYHLVAPALGFGVLSFLGLGASLLLLAFLYQRFVFREDPA